MIWSTLFIVCILQGLFLISLLILKRAKNPLASNLLSALILLMILSNLGYLVMHTGLVNYVPQFAGVSYGMVLLFGPLIYFYSKSVVNKTFQWNKKCWLHFIPYLLQVFANIPYYVAGRNQWLHSINIFLAGELPFNVFGKIIFAVQDIHLTIYIFITYGWLKKAENNYADKQYIISVSSRLKWLTTLTISFSLLLFTAVSLYIFVFIVGKYNPVTNYIYTLATTAIIYFIVFKLLLTPELITPDFAAKYQSYMQFNDGSGEKYLQKLKLLMDDTKIYLNPNLKLSALAEKIGLPSHQLSKLINEKFGKSFNDFVNEYRVKEFICRVNHNENENYTLFGIALEVGFNSKSSFNSAFKKITGKTPSEYKIPT